MHLSIPFMPKKKKVKSKSKMQNRLGIEALLNTIQKNSLLSSILASILVLFLLFLFNTFIPGIYFEYSSSGPLCVKSYCSEESCEKQVNTTICECTIILKNRDSKKRLENVRLYTPEESSNCFFNTTRGPIIYIGKNPVLFEKPFIDGGGTYSYTTSVVMPPPFLGWVSDFQYENETLKCMSPLELFIGYEYGSTQKGYNFLLETHERVTMPYGETIPITITVLDNRFCRVNDRICQMKVELFEFWDGISPHLVRILGFAFPWFFCE